MHRAAKRFDSLKRGLLASHTCLPHDSVIKNNRFPVTLSCSNLTLSIGAFIDSGADDCFIDLEFVKQAGISLTPLPQPLSVQALNGNFLDRVTHETEPVTLTVSGNHVENIRFKVLRSSAAPVVLGKTWLAKHNPHITWDTCEIKSWGESCFANCLRSAAPAAGKQKPPVKPADVTGVPDAYHDLSAVFSKESASILPPQRPYDCAIFYQALRYLKAGCTISPSQKKRL